MKRSIKWLLAFSAAYAAWQILVAIFPEEPEDEEGDAGCFDVVIYMPRQAPPPIH